MITTTDGITAPSRARKQSKTRSYKATPVQKATTAAVARGMAIALTQNARHIPLENTSAAEALSLARAMWTSYTSAARLLEAGAPTALRKARTNADYARREASKQLIRLSLQRAPTWPDLVGIAALTVAFEALPNENGRLEGWAGETRGALALTILAIAGISTTSLFPRSVAR